MGLFSDPTDPMKDANRYLNKIPGIGQQYYNPFIQGGQQAGNTLQGEYGKMLDPTDFINNIMKNYQESAGAQYQQKQLGQGIGATAAAGGYAGTPEHQQEYGQMANGIMSQDMQQYLQNALGVYGGGLSGEQDIYGKGFQASGSLADMLGGLLSSQAGLAFQNDSQQNASHDAFMNSLTNALGQGVGVFMGM